jgi:uncharacterized protein YndB with AHSA1/START domain
MENIKFEITINAPSLKVYDIMQADATYKQWVAVFNPTSTYEGKWHAGEKMLFIGINSEGKREGMVSRIAIAEPGKQVCIEHLGMLVNEEEVTSGPVVEGWAGAKEEYFFTETNGQTLVQVQMDSNEDFKAYFESTWPNALLKLKEICESN